ncbi:ATP-binding protein [Cecembia lonarensis]|nr:ATP-binding protein [Cecembia lonarensis]
MKAKIPNGLKCENKSFADAVLDRLVYSSHRIELEGDSMRKKKKLDV